MTALFKRIDTVFLKVMDLDQAINWYTKVLGFTLRWRMDEGGYAALNISETPLTLVQVPRDTEFTPTTFSSFNFYVSDITEAHNHLKEHQVEVGEIEDGGDVKWFWFKDPDGNRLEVCYFQE